MVQYIEFKRVSGTMPGVSSAIKNKCEQTDNLCPVAHAVVFACVTSSGHYDNQLVNKPVPHYSYLTVCRLLIITQMSTTKVPEVRDITRIERIGEKTHSP